MRLYTSSDLEKGKQMLPDIVDKITRTKQKLIEPTIDEIMAINKIVIDFIKKNNRKVYGGYAQNQLVKMKEPKDVFYGDTEEPDIDFYSPNPIVDMHELCNIFFKKGFKDVMGQEAQHKETYSVFVNQFNAADISYVPKQIFHRMPYTEIDGVHYVTPQFTIIDIYRMLTEPLFSSRRWEKMLPRLYLLQKHHPFNKATKGLKDPDAITQYKYQGDIKLMLNTVLSYLKGNDSTIVYGRYSYNKFLEASGILKSGRPEAKKYKVLEVPYYEFVSTDYKNSVTQLLDNLKAKHPNSYRDVYIVEHYPFWQFYGSSTYIMYKDAIIAHVVDYNHRCTPIKKVDGVQIGSYDFCLMMSMIAVFRMRVLKDNERYHFYNIMTSHLVEMRNYYLKKYNKNMFDDTLFQEFIAECIGEGMDPQREARLAMKERIKNRQPARYMYAPERRFNEDTSTTYMFPNSSGNPVKNKKNYRVSGNIPRMEEGRRVESGEIDEPDEGPEDLMANDKNKVKAKDNQKKVDKKISRMLNDLSSEEVY